MYYTCVRPRVVDSLSYTFYSIKHSVQSRSCLSNEKTTPNV